MTGTTQRETYRVQEFAAATGIPAPSVYRMCAAGTIPSIKLGSVVVIPASFLRNKLAEVATPNAP